MELVGTAGVNGHFWWKLPFELHQEFRDIRPSDSWKAPNMTSAADKKIIARIYWGFGLGISVILIIATIAEMYFYNPVGRIKSPKYDGPPSCFVRPYAVTDQISASCINHSYIIPHHVAVSEYGWQSGRAGRDYYRVGDDAYQISCNEGNPQLCDVAMAQYGAFAR